MARCFCPCHTHPGVYPPPCGVCGHDDREGRIVGGYRDGWEPTSKPDPIHESELSYQTKRATELEDRVLELEVQNDRLCARADELQFCLTQARIVLEHFSKMLPDFEHRKWAHGALVASDMNLTDERVARRKHLATHSLPGMTCPECPKEVPFAHD